MGVHVIKPSFPPGQQQNNNNHNTTTTTSHLLLHHPLCTSSRQIVSTLGCCTCTHTCCPRLVLLSQYCCRLSACFSRCRALPFATLAYGHSPLSTTHICPYAERL